MAVIVSGRRSAVVPRGGAFALMSLEDLAVPVVLACLGGTGFGPVDEVICANAIGPGGNPARRIALAAGLPRRVAGLTIDRQCAGGLDAVILAAALVDAGRAGVVLAGGVESYSRRPLRLSTDPGGGPPLGYDEAPFTPWPDRNPAMADAAAALAAALGHTRADQDAWAIDSHRKALAQQDWPEIVPIAGQGRDAFGRVLTPALMARARVLAGSVTVATAAVAADAAAFCLVVSDRVAQDAGLHGGLHIVSGVTLGADPEQPGLAPIPAMGMALGRAGIGPRDLCVAEIMEAYATQALACVNGAGLDPLRVNPGGGALARGHPIGASGAILAVRLFHGLGAGHGLAAIASAGGIASALVVRRSGA
jgi:acetyl-CoA C-acetyltransferase